MSKGNVTTIKKATNNMGDKFIEAIRLKLRINGKSVEALWDCSIDDLRYIYKDLHEQKSTKEKEITFDFDTEEPVDNDPDYTELKIEIVEYIAKTKHDEYEEQEKRVETELKIKELEALLKEKRKEEEKELSIEELETRLKNL